MAKKVYISQLYGDQYLRISEAFQGIERTAQFNALFAKYGSTVRRAAGDDAWLIIEPPIPESRLYDLGRGLMTVARRLGHIGNEEVIFTNETPENIEYQHPNPPKNVLPFRSSNR